MIRFSIRVVLLMAFCAALAAPFAAAQVRTEEPIRLKTPKPKIEKFKGQVIAATAVQITVRSRENERIVRTFTFTPGVKEQMEKIIDRGGYQHGDQVEIHHAPGSDVAQKIKGKPSKPR